VPQVPYNINDQIQALENRIRFLEGRAQIRPALNQIQGGDVTIGQGGRLRVQTPAATDVLYIGMVTPDHPDGSHQQGLKVYREDGSIAFSVWNSAGVGAQPISIWDKAGNILIADDLQSGGLARPYLSTDAWFDSTEYPSSTTTNTSFTQVQHLAWIKQHPKVQAFFLVRCSDGTTSGQIQLVDNSSNVIAGPITVAAGAFYYGSATGPIAGAHESQTYLHWQAMVNPGSTGNIGVKGLSTFGVQS
jgi:hypothetical protein